MARFPNQQTFKCERESGSPLSTSHHANRRTFAVRRTVSAWVVFSVSGVQVGLTVQGPPTLATASEGF